MSENKSYTIEDALYALVYGNLAGEDIPVDVVKGWLERIKATRDAERKMVAGVEMRMVRDWWDKQKEYIPGWEELDAALTMSPSDAEKRVRAMEDVVKEARRHIGCMGRAGPLEDALDALDALATSDEEGN